MKLTPEAQEYLRRVQKLLKNGPHSPKTGICFNLQYSTGEPIIQGTDSYNMVSFMAIGWKDVTDIVSYPIKPIYDSNPWEGKQGKLRRSLLRYIRTRLLRGDLVCLEQQINDYWEAKRR